MELPSAQSTGPALSSMFADDADMLELVEMFVGDLPQRVDELRKAAEADDFKQLARLAHQLKGAGGGYGFPAITDAGARVEANAKALRDTAQPPPDIDQVLQDLAELIDLCQRAAA